MDYMKDLFQMQENMFKSFQDFYSPKTEKKEEGFAGKMKEFYDMQMKMMEAWSGTSNPFDVYKKLWETPGFSMDSYKSFIDMQKLFFDNMERGRDFYSKGFNLYDFMPYNLDKAHEGWDKYKEFYSKFDLGKVFDPQVSKLMDKVSNANKFYLEIYDFWKKLSSEYMNAMDMDSKKYREFIEEHANMAYDMLTSTLPNEFKFVFQGGREVGENYFNTLMNFYGPWREEIGDLRDLFMLGLLNNDSEKTTEFFQLWKEKYDQTFGKILNSPALGLSGNLIEKQNKAFDKFVEVFIISNEFATKLNGVQNEAFTKIMEEYGHLSKDGMEIKSFEEFYSFWSVKMDDYLVDYFASPEFSKLLGQYAEVFMDFKIQMNDLVESYLSDTPIVTEGKIDSMIKNIYDLKKEVKALKKELEDLKKSGEEKKDK